MPSTFDFVLFPVMANSVLLVTVGILYNSATGRRYPHSQVLERSSTSRRAAGSARKIWTQC